MAWIDPTPVAQNDVLTSAKWNQDVVANTEALRVPPSVRAVRTSDLTGYTSGEPISWQAEEWDTDAMWNSGEPTKIYFRTPGIYSVSLKVRLSCTATLTGLTLGAATDALTTTTTTYVCSFAPDSATNGFGLMHFLARMDAGSFMTFGAFPKGGSSYALKGYTSDRNDQSHLTATWIGQAS